VISKTGQLSWQAKQGRGECARTWLQNLRTHREEKEEKEGNHARQKYLVGGGCDSKTWTVQILPPPEGEKICLGVLAPQRPRGEKGRKRKGGRLTQMFKAVERGDKRRGKERTGPKPNPV